MKIEISLSAASTYFHMSQVELQAGETVEWGGKKPSGTLGDYEKILESLRPADKPSRLSAFYLANKREVVEHLGGSYLYKVQSVGKQSSHYLGWLGILTEYAPPDFFNGFRIKNFKSKIDDDVRYICAQYWAGEKVTKADLKKYGVESDYETNMLITLAEKIKVLKEI